MRAQKPQRPSLDTSFSSLSLETTRASSSSATGTTARTRADSAASRSSSSAFATPPEGHSPRHSRIPLTTSTASSTATATQEDFKGPFKSDETVTLTQSPRSLHTRTASVGSPPLHEFVKAKYDYVPDHPSGLPFYAGQLIQVHYKDPSGWWDGEVANVRGWFPSNYLFQNSSMFVRASSQSSRRLATHRSRNASIDIVTPADRQNAQARPVFPSNTNATTKNANSASNTTTTNTSHVSSRQNAGSTASSAYSRRRPSLATTEEREEEGHEEVAVTNPSTQVQRRTDYDFTWNGLRRPSISRSVSGQSLANSYFQTYYGTSGAYHSQPSTSTSPTPQQQSQDWASLSFQDLVTLQTHLVRPSPLSALRHPDPSIPFEADLIRRFSVISAATSNSQSSTGDSSGSNLSLANSADQSRRGSDAGNNYKAGTGGAQFLNIVHHALWVMENAVIATDSPEDATSPSGDGGSRRGSLEGVSDSLIARDHLAPAMACVIGTVRSVLSSSDCLPRESETLRRYPVLLGHRKIVLGELARLVSQTRRVGNRGSEDEPLSPIYDDMSRRGSGQSSSLHGASISSEEPGTLGCILDASNDIEIRRQLERCQAVYDGVRRFVIAAIEAGIHFEEPPIGVQGLFGLGEDDRASEGSGATGEGSWEEDHGFHFRMGSGGSLNGHAEDPSGSGQASPPQATEAEKYAIRARLFADARPGHARRRTGSNASMSLSHSSGSASGGSRHSGGSATAPLQIRSAAPDGIQQRLQQVTFGILPSGHSRASASTTSANPPVGGGVRRGTDAANSGADSRAASALAAAAAMRAAKSLGDLRARYQQKTSASGADGAEDNNNEPAPLSGGARPRPGSQLHPELKAARRAKVIHGRSAEPTYDEKFQPRANKSSISSVSSAESSSSNASSASPSHSSSPPNSPALPSGPCTVLQVLQALRTTQDRILHGTAAFIGAAQYHTRLSHPSSKTYIVSLTREIVDFVRRLLLIADAVLGNATIRSGRAREVELAGVYKARLYVEMNRVVDAVRELTSMHHSEDSDAGSSANHGDGDADEEEKNTALKRAHLTNKCAAELVLALKLCLSFRATATTGGSADRALLIVIPSEVAVAPRGGSEVGSESFSPASPATSISQTINSTSRNQSFSSLRSSVVSPEATPKVRPPYSRLYASAGDIRATTLANRARSHTTKNSYAERIPEKSLHKKAVSMMGMNSVYRAQTATKEQQPLEEETTEDEEHVVDIKKPQHTQTISDLTELEDERDEESDRERYPLLMSEQEFSDGQEDETHEELENRMTVDYSAHKNLPSDQVVVVVSQSRSRKSIEQVRRSLEMGITRRPSMNLLEPTTPLDGTEEVVELEEEEDAEVEVRSPTTEKDLPQPPSSPLPGHPPRPAHAPPPKPANHDGLVVSNNGNIVFNSDGVVVGATLQALIDRITPADTFADTKLASYFLLTFRLFATPSDLVDAIIHRFNNPTTSGPSIEDKSPIQTSATLSDAQKSHLADVVQIRVLNFLKEWTRGHWYPARDLDSVPKLVAFCKEIVSNGNPKAAPVAKRMLQTLNELSAGANAENTLLDRMRSAGRLRDQQANLASSLTTPTTPISSTPIGDVPRPEVNRSLMSQLKTRQYTNVSLLDFSPVEMARQLTLLESRLYCQAPPEEVIESGMNGRKTPNVKALISLSTTITGWVTDWVLKEGYDLKKRIAVVKFFLKVGRECLSLSNYSTVRSMMGALESAPISRLRSVWAGIPHKHMQVLHEMRELSDYSRNSAKYRARLRNTAAPAVPFLGLILTDVTFTRDGNGALRPSPVDPSKMLINFNRYNRLAKIMADMIRLQQPYNLKEIGEVQQYLTYVLEPTRITQDADLLHRRSHLIEPRVEEDTKQGRSDLFGWANFGSIRGNPGAPP
ncbi:hypothetical protein M408DRAFT_329521 [Serendipita vermifera MAFF 305830]|uniref:Ras GEF n=1 Tax=Serendipita vermifera MAFF 305830 TaxID=933852 RepID=A0A0C3BAI9_SERVB|nr:hypothetical protein M408DRAFT_329521 [Serendipita vermifera MAFF 305830]